MNHNKNNLIIKRESKMLSAVKDILTKEVDVKEFLEMEIELTKLKQLLATEIKLKEFLVKEIDLSSLMSKKSSEDSMLERISSDQAVDEIDISAETNSSIDVTKQLASNVKNDLPVFDYFLIELLTEQHKNIRSTFNRLMSFAIEKDYVKASGHLEIFNGKIRQHYKKADVGLYAYLRTYVRIKYPQREKAFSQLSLEMKNNSIEIFYIISQSPNIPVTEKTYDAFMKEFMAVGKLMNDRINREQDLLFKMYEQTNVVKTIS